ncbi:MAG: metallophosphoesterase, partial [Actinomycetota bacterium]|nr:metallophosphoesterase [Actinomycetota bacterium]
ELYVVGLGPKLPGLSRPDHAFAGVPERAPRVVFMHNPNSFPAIPPRDAPLAIAAHTHCGQIALPGLPRWWYLELVFEERQVVVDGFAPQAYGAPGNGLFVTCGIGFSFVPIRIGAPPQLVFFEFTRAP